MDETMRLSGIIESPRAVGALKAAGFNTIADLQGATLDSLESLKGVGPRTVEQLKELGVGEKSKVWEDVEEGDHPIHFQSQHDAMSIILLPGDFVAHGGGRKGGRMVPGIIAQAEHGRGTVTREQWLMAQYGRDKALVDQHVKSKKPWRKDAVQWLRNRKACGRDYHLLID